MADRVLIGSGRGPVEPLLEWLAQAEAKAGDGGCVEVHVAADWFLASYQYAAILQVLSTLGVLPCGTGWLVATYFHIQNRGWAIRIRYQVQLGSSAVDAVRQALNEARMTVVDWWEVWAIPSYQPPSTEPPLPWPWRSPGQDGGGAGQGTGLDWGTRATLLAALLFATFFTLRARPGPWREGS